MLIIANYNELTRSRKLFIGTFALISKFSAYDYAILYYMQVMARSSPQVKRTLVKHLRTTFKEVVAVTGDGTNDAPALYEADIGLAMGIAGTYVSTFLVILIFRKLILMQSIYVDKNMFIFQVAKESADVIILDDNFSTIVTVGKWGRSVYINIKKIVQFQVPVIMVVPILNFFSACLTGRSISLCILYIYIHTHSFTPF